MSTGLKIRSFMSIADEIETHLQIVNDRIDEIWVNEAWGNFLRSIEYQNYTDAPEGNKLLKKVKGWNKKRHNEFKDSYQEFSVEHLCYSLDTRKKYGKKMLDTLKSYNMMDEKEYQKLLPATKEIPAKGAVDPLMDRLKEYYLVPILDKNDYKKLTTPFSGNEVFQAFLDYSPINAEPFIFRELLYKVRSYRMHRGDREAVTIYFNHYHSSYVGDTAEFVRKLSGNVHLFRELEESVKEPLDALALAVRQLDWAKEGEATTKSVDIKKRTNTNKINQEQEIYWV
mmetsp:Transcript_21122/g.31299  ORF Transcript_21122/g.31299 Transcript_21122/m.31299 type:complete len:284 (+) Transcript_21122:219-1070(+)|eukprot:CAMPEP_0194202376 /NCGR_PEP_ID=MMETSP0156-20130528/2413_1 /TAXON_ID=33649 /ORGANISM="Thalassionema nitzschioides, Strain L26-B" /LENGTH=283 /DNA_ID=CAMNT_0038927849 /DNA_START=210 /DNA_END=1061 /DNA_ORIENTATION=+